MGLTIGVDLGGTKIAAGVVDETGNIIESSRVPTPTNSAAAVTEAMIGLIKDLAHGRDITGVCVAVPGFVDASRSTLMFTPNLPFRKEPLRSSIEAATAIPTVVENDANAAAWAEVRFGAARNARNAVLFTVGTGLGGGIVVDSRLVRGAFGMAAEVGHIPMVPDGIECGCGQRGCWEQYASGNALLRMARELAAARRAEAGILLALGDNTPEGIQGEHVTAAAQAGCPVATAAFDQLGFYLGKGMAAVSALLDPEIFIVGGGVCVAGDILLNPTRKSFEQHLTARAHRPMPQILTAVMGNEAGLVGAADLARSA